MFLSKNLILITGAAGFIGAALAKKLLSNGEVVLGIDNINNYYDKKLKLARLYSIEDSVSNSKNSWKFEKISIEDKNLVESIFHKYKPKVVINLAAQAGVRYSIENPNAYFYSNLLGFGNILEASRKVEVSNLIYASSSSVYGGNLRLPYSETDSVDHPISLYAATKKSNELIAHSYSSIYGIPTTGLRFFTVYGPWGRPDMAPMIFTKAIFAGKPIKVFNNGDMMRDFTFIDDVVEAIFRCCYKPATIDLKFNREIPNSSTSFAPHRIFNLGGENPIKLTDFIEILEDSIGKKAIKNFLQLQPGDVEKTAANNSRIKNWLDFQPKTTIVEGIDIFIDWYKKFYKV